jgi:DNA polymerase alpha subunit A
MYLGAHLFSKAKREKKSGPRGKPPPEPAPMAAYRKVVSEEKEDDFMKSILSDMDAAPVLSRSNPRKRKNSPDFDYAIDYHTYRDHDAGSSDGGDDFGNNGVSAQASSDEDYYCTPAKKFKAADGKSINVIPAAKRMGKLEIDDGPDEYDDEFGAFPDYEMELDESPIKKEPRIEKGPMIKQEPTPVTIPPPKPSTSHPNVKKEEPPSWLAVHAALTSAPEETIGGSTSNLPSSKVQALEEDGTLHFFWFDYQEENGVVSLIGKVLDKSTGRYVSASVSVQGIQRNLFVLPRPRQMDGEYETDITPSQMDVFKDMDAVRKQWDIKKWKAKWVRRSYAFGESDVPTEETEWLKVVYGFDGRYLHQSHILCKVLTGAQNHLSMMRFPLQIFCVSSARAPARSSCSSLRGR